MKKRIRLTEGQLHRLIEQVIRQEEQRQRKSNLAHKVTEGVIRKLNEWEFLRDDCISFDNAEEAFKFVKDNMGQNEDFFLNDGYLYFGWNKIVADAKDIKEFIESPYGNKYSEEQCNNLEKNDNTLLAFIRWIDCLQGFLACDFVDEVNDLEKYNL